MKWLLLFASLFFKPFSRQNSTSLNPAIEIKQFFVENSKKVLMAFFATSILSLTFVAGLLVTVITLSAQYDQNAGFGLSAMLLGGLGMMGVSLLFSWIILSPSRETREDRRMEKSNERIEELEANRSTGHGSVSDALVLLIQDFVKEREFKRAQTLEPITTSRSERERERERTPEDSYYARPEETSLHH